MQDGIVIRPDQIEDLGWHIANPRGLVGHEPGVGKTPIVCLLAYYRWAEEAKRTVWTQPQSLLKKNARELLKFTDFAPEDIVILTEDNKKLTKAWTGPTLERVKTTRTPILDADGNIQFDKKGRRIVAKTETFEVVADLIAAAGAAKVFLCGYRFFALHWERMLQAFPDIDQCIIDEAHMAYGGHESQTTLELHQAMRHITYFAPMTATLMDGRLDSVFPILHLIEPLYYGSYNGFLEQHAAHFDPFGKVTRWMNTDKVETILQRHQTKRTFAATYGPEAVVHFHEEVEMAEGHRAKYDEFHLLAMLELEDGTYIDGALPGVATIRARQIMGHPETLGIITPNGKDERLLVHAATSGPMIVFSVHVAEQNRLVKILIEAGRKVGLINGSVPLKTRDQIDVAFNTGLIDTIVASPECAAVGYNWGRADHIIGITVDYSDVTWVQAFRRGLRGTRTTPLRVTTIAYENTIDQRVMAIAVAKSVLGHAVDKDRAVLSFVS